MLYDQNVNAHGDNGALPAELFLNSYPLPILFRVGVGMPVTVDANNKIYIALDAFHPSDNTESVSMGAEWTIFNLFSLSGYGLSFDYAWTDHKRLDSTQRLTLGVTF